MTPFPSMSGMPGFRLVRRFERPAFHVDRMIWSPDASRLAAISRQGHVQVFNSETGDLHPMLLGMPAQDGTLTWSKDSRLFATKGTTGITIWKDDSNHAVRILRVFNTTHCGLAWSPLGNLLAAGTNGGFLLLIDAETGAEYKSISLRDANPLVVQDISLLAGTQGAIHRVCWSPKGQQIACDVSGEMVLVNEQTGRVLPLTRSDFAGPLGGTVLAWAPSGRAVIGGNANGLVTIWNSTSRTGVHELEGHTGAVTSLSFAGPRFLATASRSRLIFWQCDDWRVLSDLEGRRQDIQPCCCAFHPHQPLLATFDRRKELEIWEIDCPTIFNHIAVSALVHDCSAKVVLVGESNVGKSCLGRRLSEDRYEEHETTHAIQFWMMPVQPDDTNSPLRKGEKREIVLWDMGGQDEYRLIHQLFFGDTTLALVLLDPTRGRAAFEEAKEWSTRLDRQVRGGRTIKLLIGAKRDSPGDLVDRAALQQLMRECTFAGYYETSAKTGYGIEILRASILKHINWQRLTKTSRPILFQNIRDEINNKRASGEVVLFLADLEEHIRRQAPDHFDRDAVDAVVKQLEMQGVIVGTTLGTGERALILQIGAIEKYAGSVIVAARNNPRGVPAIEEQLLASPRMTFAGIPDDQRLARTKERVVLECVVQMLLLHGIATQHEGTLVFPALFRPTETDTGEHFPYTVSLAYDFSGAIDNIYSALVAALALGERFGRMRLWKDRAEFESSGQGASGIRKVAHGSGLAHLDVYFDQKTPKHTTKLFVNFIETLLRAHGVNIKEHLRIVCPCGHPFPERTVRQRLEKGFADVGCPDCDRRIRISEGAEQARIADAGLVEKTIALRTRISGRVRKVVLEAKKPFSADEGEPNLLSTIRILHLSDLHISADADPIAMLRPLVADIKDHGSGLDIQRLDYLVVSGDFGNRATPQEFERARILISELIKQFHLTAERCILVPGNHDVDWDEQVYTLTSRRLVGNRKLTAESYFDSGTLLAIRDDTRYPQRFKSFSENFYHPLTQQEYPLRYEDQCIPYIFPDDNLQFITMNSCWELDEYFPKRCSIHEGALARGLQRADEQIVMARAAGQLSATGHPLRIGVWHHAVTGNDKIVDDAFLDQMRQANVHMCLHGDVHELRAHLVGYTHPTRQLHIIGGGSFGAPAAHRPESTPQLFNVIELDRQNSLVRVHTRCRLRSGGAWEGWAIWPGPDSTTKRTYYEFPMSPLVLQA